VKTKELARKQILAVRCITCGADKNKPCELASGKRRTNPHRERQWAAADKRLYDEANEATAQRLQSATSPASA